MVKGGSPAVARIIEYNEVNGSKFGTLYHDGAINLKPNGDTVVNLIREFADNAGAVLAGLSVGTIYRTDEVLKIVF